MTELQILKLRISVIFKKEQYTFLNTLNDFQITLKKYFSIEYSLDQIENALMEMEEQFLENNEDVIEIPEDFTF